MGLFSKKTKEDKKDVAKKVDVKVKAAKKEVKKAETKKVIKKSSKKAGEAYRFLLRPIISEKATIGASDGKYTFEVSMDANKVAIKKAIEELYGAKVLTVNTLITHNNKKKAYVKFSNETPAIDIATKIGLM